MRIARHAGTVLAITGLLLVGFSLYEVVSGKIYQALRGPELDREIATIPPMPEPQRHSFTYQKGSAIGRLEIPRIGLSVVVLEGSDQGTLRLGVGRMPESSIPGDLGNVVLAGHRDTFFRPLREIRPGDRISLRTSQGTFPYTVDWTKVVKPTDTSVILPTAAPALTLVTCYPFSYIGPAPQRFIVRALPLSTVSADAATPPAGKPSPFALIQPRVAPPAQARTANPVAHPAIAESDEPETPVAVRPAVMRAPAPIARPVVSVAAPTTAKPTVAPARVPVARPVAASFEPTPVPVARPITATAGPSVAPAPIPAAHLPAAAAAEPESLGPHRPGPVKRAFHKIKGVFSSHRDKLQE